MVHSVLVDECEGLVYAASREAGKVVALHLDPKNRLKLEATYDLAPHGHGLVGGKGGDRERGRARGGGGKEGIVQKDLLDTLHRATG